MNKNINPDFIETIEQREFRHEFIKKIYSVYHFDDNVGLMDIGEDKKISLQDIYVPIRFSEMELSEERDWGTNENTVSILELLNQSKHVILSGKPGSGKTTISKIIINMLASKALTAFTDKYGRRIPLYFKLRDYKIKNIKTATDLIDMYIENQSKTLGMDISRDILEFYLKKGWCFILFDGVDEVGGIENRLKIREILLKHFVFYNDNNYIIVTSRPTGLEHVPFHEFIEESEKKSKNVELLKLFYVDSFNKNQVRQFSEKWFALREHNPKIIKDKTDEFLDSVEKIKSLSMLRRRPVFLTMMIHIHTTKGKLPYSRVTAYEYMTVAYIESIDITRRLHKEMYPDEKYAEWNFEDKIKLLQGIAYEFHSITNKNKEVQIVVTREQLLAIIEKNIREKKDEFQTIKIEDKEALLSFYLTRTGLLHEPEQDKIQFSHLSFQEYLTARYIYKEIIENFFEAQEIINEKIISRFNQDDYSRWQEVILLFFSMNKTSTDRILELMKDKKQSMDYKYYFTYTIILMMKSEEYGIKKDQRKKWLKVVIENIGIYEMNGKFQTKVFMINNLLKFFLANQQIDIQPEYLKEYFHEYYKKVKLEQPSEKNLWIYRVILIIILYNKNTAEDLKSELDLAIKTIISRKQNKLFFISCLEGYHDYFQESSSDIADLYDLEEKIIARDFLSSAVYHEFINSNRWDYKILQYEYISSGLLVIKVFLDKMNEYNSREKMKYKYNEMFFNLDKSENDLWLENWNTVLWRSEFMGYKLAKYRNIARGLAVQSFSKIDKSYDNRMYNNRLSEIIDDCDEDKKIRSELKTIDFDDFIENHEKIRSIFNGKEMKKKNKVLLNYCEIIKTTFLVVFSDYKFYTTCKTINIFWESINDVKMFKRMCSEPKELYDHLDCTKEIEYPSFLEQYTKYFSKSYCFVNMLKEIEECNDEKILKYSHIDILKLCVEGMQRILDDVQKNINDDNVCE